MKQKILFLMADLGGGGAEKVLVNLVNALPTDKYDITIRTIFGKGVNAKFLAPHIKYSSLLPCKMMRGYVMLQKLIPRRWLYKLLVHGKYDIEIAYMMHAPTRALGGSNSSAKNTHGVIFYICLKLHTAIKMNFYQLIRALTELHLYHVMLCKISTIAILCIHMAGSCIM